MLQRGDLAAIELGSRHPTVYVDPIRWGAFSDDQRADRLAWVWSYRFGDDSGRWAVPMVADVRDGRPIGGYSTRTGYAGR